MPNWCYNRVTAYANDEHQDKLKEVEKIFESKTPFNDIFPMPDWKNTPNEKGELPVLEQMNKRGLRYRVLLQILLWWSFFKMFLYSLNINHNV